MLADKDRMLGAVGHDLRTPLASLRVRVEQVDDDRLREKMIASIEEMTAMLADILALARSGAGTEAPEAIALPLLLRELTADYGEQGKDVAAGALAEAAVRARPMLLRRVLRNLIDNARSFSAPDGVVRVSLGRQKGQALIIVDDDGPGIPHENLESIFERFYTSRPKGTAFGGNSGLGLSIVRQIILAHGGAVRAENRPSPSAAGDAPSAEAGDIAGARFTVVLPEARR
ncbi:MAG: sensor histidine kinase, partial [Parvularculaceae bacterium]